MSERRHEVEIDGPVPAATPIFLVDGNWRHVGDVGLTVCTQALHYGTAVFDGIRGYWIEAARTTNLFRLSDHVARFMSSCRFLHLDVGMTDNALEEAVARLVEKNAHHGDLYIRLIAYKSKLLPGAPFGVRLRGVANGVAAYCLPMPSAGGADVPGMRCCTSSWQRIPDQAVPARHKIAGSYVNVALALDEAEAAGYDDAILLNARGFVAEATTANVFLVLGTELVTPTVSSDILPGITRASVIDIARDRNVAVVERDVQRSELLAADEVFLSGTGCEIAPVVEVDGRRIGTGKPGPITRRILDAFGTATRADEDTFRNWITPVVLPAQSHHRATS